MTEDEYKNIYASVLLLDEDFEPVVLDFEILPGETEGQAQLRYLLDLNILIDDGDNVVVDRQKAMDYDPNLVKVLDALYMSEHLARLDKLVDDGLAYVSVDEEGNIVYVENN